MTAKDNDHFDDNEFEAFLLGQGDLARHLRALPQPSPSAALDAVILAEVEADLVISAARRPDVVNDAANDAIMPGSAVNVRSSFISRWRMSLSIAASVVGCILLLLQWQQQQQSPMPVVVALAPQPTVPAMVSRSLKQPTIAVPTVAVRLPAISTTETSPATPLSGAGSEADVDRRDAAPAIQVAQADMQELRQKSVSQTITQAMPSPAEVSVEALPVPLAVMPTSEPMPATDADKAKAWLALIEEMLKVDLRQDALAEWEKFRKVYPNYPVPDKLAAQIRVLKK